MIASHRFASYRFALVLLGAVLFFLLAPWTKAHAATYMIDWDHPNTGLLIFGQGTPTAFVAGNILNTSDGTDSGYDFTLSLVINDSIGLRPSFSATSPSVALAGSQFGLNVEMESTGRDATTEIVGSLSVSGGTNTFAAFDITFLDIDSAPANGAVDELEVLFGTGSNSYTYNIFTIARSGDSFRGLATVPPASSDGNVAVSNPGLSTNVLDFKLKSGAGDTFSAPSQDFALGDAQFDIVAVPEPSAALFLTLGAGLILRRRRANAV